MNRATSHRVSSRLAAAFRRAALPLASYYAVTLAVPLANGAARSGDVFLEHALVVLMVPPLAVLLVRVAHDVTRAAVGKVLPAQRATASARPNHHAACRSTRSRISTSR